MGYSTIISGSGGGFWCNKLLSSSLRDYFKLACGTKEGYHKTADMASSTIDNSYLDSKRPAAFSVYTTLCSHQDKGEMDVGEDNNMDTNSRGYQQNIEVT